MANTLVLDKDKTKVLCPYEIVSCYEEAPEPQHGPDLVFTRDDLLRFTPKQIVAMMKGEMVKPTK